MTDILDVIFSRRSIRKYQDQPVPRELLEKMLQAAMSAPSARNGKPWEFVVVTQPETMDELRTHLEYGHYNAPAAIAVCCNLALSTTPSSERFWVQDCTAALENMLIAAAGLGLGTVWLGIYPKPELVEFIQKTLGLPQSVTPLAVVYTGYPLEPKPPRTQYDERRVHWEKYELTISQ